MSEECSLHHTDYTNRASSDRRHTISVYGSPNHVSSMCRPVKDTFIWFVNKTHDTRIGFPPYIDLTLARDHGSGQRYAYSRAVVFTNLWIVAPRQCRASYHAWSPSKAVRKEASLLAMHAERSRELYMDCGRPETETPHLSTPRRSTSAIPGSLAHAFTSLGSLKPDSSRCTCLCPWLRQLI